MKEELFFCFKCAAFISVILFAGCSDPFPESPRNELRFTVADVGQGLSQFCILGDSALLFDIGPPEAKNSWLAVYRKQGRPYLKAIVLSHRESDHCGGLEYIDSTVNWSGTCVVSFLEDSSFIRSTCVKWNRPIRFRTVAQGDSLLLDGECTVRCLWPPREILPEIELPVDGSLVNYYSLCMQVLFHSTRILMSGDLDSAALRQVTRTYTTELEADLVVVPHHGSDGSLYPLFYDYVRPGAVVISCGKDNTYGHPGDQTITTFTNRVILWYSTEEAGTLCWDSDGYSLSKQ